MANIQHEKFSLTENQTKIPLPSDGSTRYERYASKSSFHKLKENYRHKLLGDNKSIGNVQNIKDYEDDFSHQDAKIKRNHSHTQVYPTTNSISHRSFSTDSLYKSDSEAKHPGHKSHNGFNRIGSENDTTNHDRDYIPANETGFSKQWTRDNQYNVIDRSYSRYSDSIIDSQKTPIVRSYITSGHPIKFIGSSPIIPNFKDDSKESCFLRGYEQLQQQMHARRIEVERMTAARESIADFYYSKPDRRMHTTHQKNPMFPPISPGIKSRDRTLGSRESVMDVRYDTLKPNKARQDTFNLNEEDSQDLPLSINDRKPQNQSENKTSSRDSNENNYSISKSGVIIEDEHFEDDPAPRRKRNSKKS